MPYYTWEGVDALGNVIYGKLYAKHAQELDEQLFARRIACVAHKKIRSYAIMFSIRESDRANYYISLSRLVNAGVFISEAVYIVADNMHASALSTYAHKIAHCVHGGQAFDRALVASQFETDALVLQLVVAGQEGGQLGSALQVVADYYADRMKYKRQLRKVLFMPMLGCVFFFILMLSIFLFVIPQFSFLFKQVGRSIPASTQRLFSISLYIRQYLLVLLGAMGAIGIGVWWYVRRHLVRIALRMPYVKTIYREHFYAVFFRSLGLLIERGVSTTQALQILGSSDFFVSYKPTIQLLSELVQIGHPLSLALANTEQITFLPELCAMIAVAERSTSLPTVLQRISIDYTAQAHRRTERLIGLVQPVLLLIIGLGVTGLLLTLYGPIFSFTTII